MVVGDRGSGKNIFATALTGFVRQNFPQVRCYTNTEIRMKGVILRDDILRTLAIRTIAAMRGIHLPLDFAVVDEAAIAGLESRGSGTESTDSYIVALSRKANVHLLLLTQLRSMLEKRSRWIGDYSILCEAIYRTHREDPDYFKYGIYDRHDTKVNEVRIQGWKARNFLYGKFDTGDVPMKASLMKRFKSYYNIEDEDILQHIEGKDDQTAEIYSSKGTL